MTMRAIEALVAAVLAAERERCAMSESLARPFRCSECGTRVASARPRPDATWEVRHGVSMSLPDDVLVPTCEHCGEWFVDGALTDCIQKRLEESLALAR